MSLPTPPPEVRRCAQCKQTFPVRLMANDYCLKCTSYYDGSLQAQRFDAMKRRLAGKSVEQPSNAFAPAAIVEPARQEALAVGGPDVRAEAMKERARRELARRRLLPFILRFNAAYKAGWVHKDICQRLEQFSQDVVDKKSPRLMLFLPPRHGKSELASRSFPAWHLGHNPEHEVMACSYSASLAMKFSRKARGLVSEPGYKELFPEARLDPDNKSVENWTLLKGGSYMAVGIGGPATGSGFHIGIIDDPVKNREEADSATMREAIVDWYTSTFYTRMAPGAGVLVILTRWHYADLAGWLLDREKEGADKWEIIEYPAIAEHDEKYRKAGEALHPERYDLEALGRIRKAVGVRDWAAMYQQKPVLDEGAFFKLEMIRYYMPSDLPLIEELKLYTAWDLAVGQKEVNDWSVGLVVGVDVRENIYILERKRVRRDALGLVDLILDMHEQWPSEQTGIEKGHIEMAIGPFLKKRIRERRLYTFNHVELKTGRRDKIARARSIQGRMEQGMVYFPARSPWVQELVDELLHFPVATFDDQVDALSWIGQMLDQFVTWQAPRVVPGKSWRDRLKAISDVHKSFMSA